MEILNKNYKKIGKNIGFFQKNYIKKQKKYTVISRNYREIQKYKEIQGNTENCFKNSKS